MDCSEVKELLSAYYDGELSSDKWRGVETHLERCEDCRQVLAAFQSLSVLAQGLAEPEPPAQLWHQLEGQLSTAPASVVRPTVFLEWAGRPAVRIALAAAAVVLITVGWVGYRRWVEHRGEHEFAAEFGQYLDEFNHDPNAAQQFLLAKYDGQVVNADQALQQVGYRPAVADGAPDGYSIESIYVMKMPCCTCVQCLCKGTDGNIIAIFEHDDEETTQWFGDRPAISTLCHGTRCSLVELGDGLAASWKRGERYMTVIGARDTDEIGQLVAWFDRHKPIGPG
jgi:anti-sigma factor RsiW